MKLLGKDITPAKVMAFVGERLQARGLSVRDDDGAIANGVEPRVDPLTFNLQALEANADATSGLPLETHREGLSGRAVVLAKRLFRKAGQVFINEALGRQTVFNGHVRDSYAQLSAEVMRLRQRVAELEQQPAVMPPPVEPKPKMAVKPPKKAPPAPPSAPRPPPRNSRRGK
jgi:DNA-binding response OmpR family regulator